MARLFTAIEIPSDVAAELSALRGGIHGGRWIDAQNYHITLRFIGDVDDSVARDVMVMLGRVRRRTFEIRLLGLDQFGGKKPRAVFAAVAPNAALNELQAEHERTFQRIGLEPESRKFMPHVTLARLRDSSPRDVADYLASRGGYRSGPIQVSRFVLYSSRSSMGGGPYVVEAAYPLELAPPLKSASQATI